MKDFKKKNCGNEFENVLQLLVTFLTLSVKICQLLLSYTLNDVVAYRPFPKFKHCTTPGDQYSQSVAHRLE